MVGVDLGQGHRGGNRRWCGRGSSRGRGVDWRTGVGVGAGLGVGGDVAVGVRPGAGACVAVGVGDGSGVGTGVGTAVGAAAGIAVGTDVAVGVSPWQARATIAANITAASAVLHAFEVIPVVTSFYSDSRPASTNLAGRTSGHPPLSEACCALSCGPTRPGRNPSRGTRARLRRRGRSPALSSGPRTCRSPRGWRT